MPWVQEPGAGVPTWSGEVGFSGGFIIPAAEYVRVSTTEGDSFGAFTHDGASDWTAGDPEMGFPPTFQKFTVSFWIWFTAGADTVRQHVLSLSSNSPSTGRHFDITRTDSSLGSKWRIWGRNTSHVSVCDVRSTNAWNSADGWHHVWAQGDLAAGTVELKINGVDETNITKLTAGQHFLSQFNFADAFCVGAQGNTFRPKNPLHAHLAALWFDLDDDHTIDEVYNPDSPPSFPPDDDDGSTIIDDDGQDGQTQDTMDGDELPEVDGPPDAQGPVWTDPSVKPACPGAGWTGETPQ